MKEYVGIYIKTEKAQEQDGFGNKMKYHFHITTVHKYRFFVFCLYSSCVYLNNGVLFYCLVIGCIIFLISLINYKFILLDAICSILLISEIKKKNRFYNVALVNYMYTMYMHNYN